MEQIAQTECGGSILGEMPNLIKKSPQKLPYLTLLWARVWTWWSQEVSSDFSHLMFLEVSLFCFTKANFLCYSMMSNECLKKITCFSYLHLSSHHECGHEAWSVRWDLRHYRTKRMKILYENVTLKFHTFGLLFPCLLFSSWTWSMRLQMLPSFCLWSPCIT